MNVDGYWESIYILMPLEGWYDTCAAYLQRHYAGLFPCLTLIRCWLEPGLSSVNSQCASWMCLERDICYEVNYLASSSLLRFMIEWCVIFTIIFITVSCLECKMLPWMNIAGPHCLTQLEQSWTLKTMKLIVLH